MCKRGKVKSVEIWQRDGLSSFVMIDECIATIVQALNKGGIRTIASCCGHGKHDGSIILMDGRELLIRKDPYIKGNNISK